MLALTFTNPMTILSFAALFAGAGSGGAAGGPAAAALLVAGVFAGSAGWWLVSGLIAGDFRERFDATWHRRLDRASGIVIAGFGLSQRLRLVLG